MTSSDPSSTEVDFAYFILRHPDKKHVLIACKNKKMHWAEGNRIHPGFKRVVNDKDLAKVYESAEGKPRVVYLGGGCPVMNGGGNFCFPGGSDPNSRRLIKDLALIEMWQETGLDIDAFDVETLDLDYYHFPSGSKKVGFLIVTPNSSDLFDVMCDIVISNLEKAVAIVESINEHTTCDEFYENDFPMISNELHFAEVVSLDEARERFNYEGGDWFVEAVQYLSDNM
jgi:8-oxo-dGTP pyrophosphatase MutT (NUDIX family)